MVVSPGTDHPRGPDGPDTTPPALLGRASAGTVGGRESVLVLNAERDRPDPAFLVIREQERIARDLHDTVIQSLFGIGLSLQATAAMAVEDRTRQRVQRAVDDIDQAIRNLRTTVFALNQPPPVSSGLREQVTAIAQDIGRSLGFAPTVDFVGPVDLAVADEVHRHLIPCLRESLSNVARHARANRVNVCLRVGDEVVLEVSDDGRGIPEGARWGHGLRNLERRAQLLGGQCRFLPRDGGGTVVQWRVPADSSGVGTPG
jgi:signal transduction histidine kinase